MKDIKNFITEASKNGFNMNWENSNEFQWSPKAMWLSINVDEGVYDWIDMEDIDSWISEYGASQKEVDEVLSMKPGDVYTPDGWNYYFRIKK
jgi:hypothetical protein